MHHNTQESDIICRAPAKHGPQLFSWLLHVLLDVYALCYMGVVMSQPYCTHSATVMQPLAHTTSGLPVLHAASAIDMLLQLVWNGHGVWRGCSCASCASEC
jgi:hypothetical protein